MNPCKSFVAFSRAPDPDCVGMRFRGRAWAVCRVSTSRNATILQAGSRFTQTFTGTTRIARQNVVKDDVVFVAGAGGRVGSRIVKECARAGYTVRAGVRSREKGQDLINSIRDEGELTPQQLRKIRAEDFDLFEPDTIAPAIGNAGAPSVNTGHALDSISTSIDPR